MKIKNKFPALLGSLFFSMAINTNAGFYVEDGLLLDTNGKPCILRGVNHAHTWFKNSTTTALPDIASVNANSVRIVLSNGTQTEGWIYDSAESVSAIIEQMKSLNMVSVLEIHDATGYPDKAGSSHMSKAVDYWLEIKDALIGEEDYVIINIANEPFGNNVPASEWIDSHIDAITRLREAGLTHTLMIDAPSWGQDWEGIMAANAPQVFAADPLKNIVFSVHMYQIYPNRNAIDSYMKKFIDDHKLPLVVGEFGADHQGEPVDEASMLELSELYNLGYMGWSWSGNNAIVEDLDITIDFDVTNLSPWGDFLINSQYGLKATAQTCSVFGGDGPVFPPKALDKHFTLIENTSAEIKLAGADLDGEVTDGTITSLPAYGEIYGSGLTRTYTPNTNFSGIDIFKYTVTDNEDNTSNEAQTTLIVASAGGIDGKPSCSVEFVRYEEWNAGSHLQLVVTNNSPLPIEGYDLSWTIGEGETFSSGYNATSFTSSGQKVTAHLDASHWNGTLTQGQSATIDYQIKKEGGLALQPSYYSLNDLTCADSGFTGTGPQVTPTPTPPITPTPTPTPTPTSTATPTPTITPTAIPNPTANCKFEITNNWGTGFTGQIVITNNGESTINGWEISWKFSDATRVTNTWNATVTGNNPYTATDVGWNGKLSPGQSAALGFQGTTDNGSVAEPTISGSVCN